VSSTPIAWGGAAYRWGEPWFYRPRLKGDLGLRFTIVAGVWAIATGGLLMLFAINVNPPGIGAALFLGFVLGGSPACLWLFMTRNEVSGAVVLREETLKVQRMSVGLTLIWATGQEWSYREVRRCAIVRRPVRGQSWSLLLLHTTTGEELISVPAKVKLEELATFLAAKGVAVTYEDHAPGAYTHGLGRSAAIAVAGVGGACLVVGVLYYVSKTPGVARWRMRAQAAATDARQRADLEREARRQGSTQLPPPGVQAEPDRGPAGAEPPPGGAIRSAPGAPWAGGGPRGGTTVPGMAPPPETVPSPTQPGPSPQAAPGDGYYDTQTAGGAGGTPHRSVSSEGKPVLGLSYWMGEWSGQEAVAALDPIWDRNAAPAGGKAVLAKEGYAVGGLKVDGKDLVCAVKVVFLRIKPDGTLDRTKSYTSDWLGKPTGQAPKTVGGTGSKVVGVHGRRGAVLDAVGLVLAKSQKG
jgi:hypothetical protein